MKAITIAPLLALALLTGCSVKPQNLAMYGDVKLNGNVLDSLTITHNEPAQLGRLPFCVASNVSNESVTVSDSANSFIGPYSGNYYSVNRSSNIGGGNVLEYVSEDKNEIVARGTIRYWAAMLERAVRFKLVIKDDGLARTYKFTSVEVAQIHSGSWPNDGFSRAAMNPGTGGGHALKNMQQLANSIDSCLRE